MRLSRAFLDYFVPHKRNKYKPHFLRPKMAIAVALSIVALFVVAVAEEKFITTGISPEAAAVVASSLVDLANADRAQSGLAPLTVSAQLQQAAQLKANDMVHSGYFAHTSPTGKDPWYWFQQAGYSFSYAGENLAVYFSDSNDVNTAWMNSPEHRANLLDPDYTQIGIAVAQGMYQGYETTFVVQEFGTPAAANSPVNPQPVAQATPVPKPAAVKPETPPTEGPLGPQVAGERVQKTPVTVVSETPEVIAVKNQTAVPLPAATAPAQTNAFVTFFLKVLTSPESDLGIAYDVIGAIIALALILEIGIEMRRQHPHRIAIGLSLIALMVVLGYADHSFVGNLIIA